MVLDKEDKICYVIEFKRAFERYGGAKEKTRLKAERQHDSLVRGLTAVYIEASRSAIGSALIALAMYVEAKGVHRH